MEVPKPIVDVRKLFKVLVIGGGLAATACGPATNCPPGQIPNPNAVDGGSADGGNGACVPGPGGGGTGGW